MSGLASWESSTATPVFGDVATGVGLTRYGEVVRGKFPGWGQRHRHPWVLLTVEHSPRSGPLRRFSAIPAKCYSGPESFPPPGTFFPDRGKCWWTAFPMPQKLFAPVEIFPEPGIVTIMLSASTR